MAIAGTGTQADPWVVTTYAELVSKAGNSGEYVKIGNDINIIAEYPDGDMPQLEIAADVNGDGKTISNWYSTSGVVIYIHGSTAQLHDCTIGNIYAHSGDSFMQIEGYNENYHFVNCNFYGVLFMPLFEAIDEKGSTNNLKSCSINIDNKGSVSAINHSQYGYTGIKSCYIKVKTTGSATDLFDTSKTTFVIDSYIETDVSCACYGDMSNCVLDLTTTESLFARNNSSTGLCIINSTHAPNATTGNGFELVDDTHWLDAAYLSSIGFNIG
jgi:hypothetical protein